MGIWQLQNAPFEQGEGAETSAGSTLLGECIHPHQKHQQ